MIIEAKSKKFSYFDTFQWEILQQKFSTGITIKELTSIAVIISNACPNLKLTKITRETKRTFSSLIQWFIDNWDAVYPILSYITLYDDSGNEINSSAELPTLRYRPRQPKATKL